MKAWREAGDMCGLKVRWPQLGDDDGGPGRAAKLQSFQSHTRSHSLELFHWIPRVISEIVPPT